MACGSHRNPQQRVRPSPFAIMGAVLAGVAILNIVKWHGAGGREKFLAMAHGRRATKAMELYLAQCDVALENPSLSSPDEGTLDFAGRRMAGSKDGFERYEWYVARLIYTLDECLRLDPHGQWEAVTQTQLSSHKAYLSSLYYAQQGYITHYSPRMRALIEQQRH